MLRTNAEGEMIGRSGMTVREWSDWHAAEFLAGRRATTREKWDFEREFVADDDGYLDGIKKICNAVTGEWVVLDPPLRVHVDDVDRVIAEYQARFLAEWEAGADERAARTAVFFGPPGAEGDRG